MVKLPMKLSQNNIRGAYGFHAYWSQMMMAKEYAARNHPNSVFAIVRNNVADKTANIVIPLRHPDANFLRMFAI